MGLVVLRSLPNVIQQGADSEITLEGYNLDDITANVTTIDGFPIQITPTVLNATPISANIRFSTDASVPLGDVLLTLTSGSWTTTVPLTVVNQQPFSPEVGTLLLWHLDETSGTTLLDSGPYGINGFSYNSSVAGRFGMTRQYDIRANTNPAVLNLGNSGFSVESWFKWEGYNNNYIFKKGNIDANSEAFAIDIRSGVIRARLRDSAQLIWEATINPQTVRVDDDKWHYISMVVRRGAAANENRLLIYIDGIERANVQSPASFGSLRNTSEVFSAGDSSIVVDEVRILNFARTPEQIAGTWSGTSAGLSISGTKNNKKSVASKNALDAGRKNKPELPKPEKPPTKSVIVSGEQSLRISRKPDKLKPNR